MDSIQKLRDPFKKKILLTRTAFSLSKYMPLQYDATFQVKDAQDWTLILTYITYSPKPLLVVSEDITIPDGLWQKVNRTTTFVNITSSYVVNIRPYDAIFFAPIEEMSTSYTEYVFKLLQSVFKASYSQKEHKEVLQELRVAGAGICWTRHEEDAANGNIYWYDPVSNNQGDNLSNKQMSELFTWLADQFKRE
jgi:ATP-dependent Clp protease adapter protein ClpS